VTSSQDSERPFEPVIGPNSVGIRGCYPHGCGPPGLFRAQNALAYSKKFLRYSRKT
jgi:hypothetical protein